ncbi:MAG: dihydroorotate dehydrogenase-like protein [Vicinamibacterales bacterium]
MDLTTTYLGLRLAHPIITGASPLVDHMDVVRRLEDAGAAAITMHSLFEEQIAAEREATWSQLDVHAEGHAEAVSYFPRADEYALGPDKYLEQIRRIKAAVAVPVIASLNGVTGRGWSDYAVAMQQAGADAIEINVYAVATDLEMAGTAVEERVIDALRLVRAAVTLPVAVKLSPFFSSVAHLGHRLDLAGADGLVLFNRFYQPDIDVDQLDVLPRLALSDSSELLLRLRWLAILSGRLRGTLAASGGIHTGVDAVKAVMAGAHAVQVVSALLHHGPEHLATIRREMEAWMTEREYASVGEMRGSMSLGRCPDPAAFERGNYVRLLQTWRPG